MEQISTKGRSNIRLFWQARFLATSLKLICSKVWAHKLVCLFQKLTCLWESSLAFGFFQAHIFPRLAWHLLLVYLRASSDRITEKNHVIDHSQSSFRRLTVDDFLLGLVDLLPHLPQYLLLHHLQVPRAPVPVYHRVCFWGILASKMGASRVCICIHLDVDKSGHSPERCGSKIQGSGRNKKEATFTSLDLRMKCEFCLREEIGSKTFRRSYRLLHCWLDVYGLGVGRTTAAEGRLCKTGWAPSI